MQRTNYSSGAKFEDIVGYSRAVKVGNIIEVAGTTAIENGELIGRGDVYLQTKTILQKIERVLHEAGVGIESVIRTRIYVTDIRRWEEVARAHSEFFQIIKPASSMIEISALIDPEMLV